MKIPVIMKTALSPQRVGSAVAKRLGRLSRMAMKQDGTAAAKSQFTALKAQTLRQLDNMLGHNGKPEWAWTAKGLTDYNRRGNISMILNEAINKTKRIAL